MVVTVSDRGAVEASSGTEDESDGSISGRGAVVASSGTGEELSSCSTGVVPGRGTEEASSGAGSALSAEVVRLSSVRSVARFS